MQLMGHSGMQTPNATIFVYGSITNEWEHLLQFAGITFKCIYIMSVTFIPILDLGTLPLCLTGIL